MPSDTDPNSFRRILMRQEAETLVRSRESRRLTPRELEVIKLLACGYSNEEIGMNLTPQITEHTVKNTITDIMIALGVRSRTAAAVVAIQRGILDIHTIEVQER